MSKVRSSSVIFEISEGHQLTLDLEPLALGAHRILVLSPCLLHGAPLALDLGLWSAPGAPWSMVSTVVPLALYLQGAACSRGPKSS